MTKLYCLLFICILSSCTSDDHQAGVTNTIKDTSLTYNEPYRPQIHFSPKEKWMNDPNGLVFVDGTYHMFYQYYPDSTVWGPMHWGHATTTDLVHWQHQPIALYPDSLGYIFSGSAVMDSNNTSGFGQNGKAPLVAIFTHHDPVGEKEKKTNYQNQSIAYSVDNGKTWKKYEGNPVLKNPGIVDFRDPKVMWHQPSEKWIMSLATKDRISFYSSPDLKSWTKESEFGEKIGAHGGVWECPDLLSFEADGKEVWVLLVSINPGGPNGGSATQYFTGSFDGKKFIPFNTKQKWIDYGPDNYAGVTWSNTGKRKLFIGWMSNWWYGQNLPTKPWRSAMTIPRELSLVKLGNEFYVSSIPVKEVNALATTQGTQNTVVIKGEIDLSEKIKGGNKPFRFQFTTGTLADFAIVLANDKGEELLIGYDDAARQYYIDRTRSGLVNFEKRFAAKHVAPRIATTASSNFQLIADGASVELFADKGLSNMTSIFFPSTPYTKLLVRSKKGLSLDSLSITELKSIWP